jgi:hypothetical protein
MGTALDPSDFPILQHWRIFGMEPRADGPTDQRQLQTALMENPQ